MDTTLLTYTGHGAEVTCVAWSPDGSRLASCTNQEIHLWDAITGACIAIWKGAFLKGVTHLAWSPENRFLACNSRKEILVLDTTTRECSLNYTGHSNLIRGIAWSPDGVYLASGGLDFSAHIWNATTGQQFHTLYPGEDAHVIAVAWSPDGTSLATATGYGAWHHSAMAWHPVAEQLASVTRMLQVWDVATGQQIWEDPLAWSPEKWKLVHGVRMDECVQIWERNTWQSLRIYPGNSEKVISVAWSPDGNYLASATLAHTVHIWNASTGELVTNYHGHNDRVTAAIWSPDGNWIASASADHTVQIWPVW